MIFHTPDTSFARLKSCWKRAAKFAAAGEIDSKHPLAPAWSNCQMFLDHEYSPLEVCEMSLAATIKRQNRETVAAHTFSISCLDWFAQKLDDYSKTNLIAGDASIAAMLYEWRARMVFDPTKI